MEKVKNMIGGLVGINEGNICNSYINIKVNTKKEIAEFCYQNEGKITKCFSDNFYKDENKLKRFCSKNSGIIESHFSIDNEDIKRSQERRKNAEILQQASNWDFQNIWTIKEKNRLMFKMDTFFEEIPVTENILVIKNEKDLYKFAKGVNKGIDKYRNANVILKKNLNLKGKKWTPIGIDKYNSFCGTFNGDGHSIENFKICQDSLNYVGFFGYIKGATICNLKIDCVCKGKRCSGALVGLNDKGNIFSCIAVTNIYVGETTGGLVGKNIGNINKCCVIGKMMPSLMISTLVRNIVIGILLVLIITIAIHQYYKEKVFVPVVIDPNVVVDEVQEEEFKGDPKDNKASFDFAQTVVVDSTNMIGTLDFRNPKRGNHNIVIKLFISDKELKEKLGTTGRNEKEQEELEKTEEYNENTYMTELYQSGLIERGYKLPNVQISKLPDGTKLVPAIYEAMISLEFYKVDTNEKAIVSTKLPITLIIK